MPFFLWALFFCCQERNFNPYRMTLTLPVCLRNKIQSSGFLTLLNKCVKQIKKTRMGIGVCVFTLQRYFHRHQTVKHIHPKSKQNFIISQLAEGNLFLHGTISRRQPWAALEAPSLSWGYRTYKFMQLNWSSLWISALISCFPSTFGLCSSCMALLSFVTHCVFDTRASVGCEIIAVR